MHAHFQRREVPLDKRMERADRQILARRALVAAKLFVVEQAAIELRDQPFAIGFIWRQQDDPVAIASN